MAADLLRYVLESHSRTTKVKSSQDDELLRAGDKPLTA